jgi:DUF1009 family protein
VKKIAIIAGEGDLPLKISAQLDLLKNPYEVIQITNGVHSNIGQIGKFLNQIKLAGATRIVFCGSVQRPSLFKLKLDSVGKKWIKKLGYRAFLGDNALLNGIIKLLQEEGIEIISPQSILGSLLTPSGVLTIRHPSEKDMYDIARGIFVLNALSKADVGQSVIIQEGLVLGIEAIEGTKNLILRTKKLKVTEVGGVLIKTSKIGQSTNIDLPTIGSQTIVECKETNLNGIALGAEVTQIIDFEQTVKIANENNIFIVGI